MRTRKKSIALLHFVLIFFVMQKSIALSFDVFKDETDTTLIPFSTLYQNTWGGENTRLRTNMLNSNQHYILPLQIDGENAFVFPTVNKTYVCSPYGIRSGRMHTGMDIKQKLGDSIVAAWDGIVRMASKNYYAYGGTVVIRHSNGLETLYAHLSNINVKENQHVKAGELIGLAGRTGRATTEHLHFETRFLYEHFDPRTIIDFTTFSLNADTLYVNKGKFSNTSPHIHDLRDNEQTPETKLIADNTSGEENQSLQDIIVIEEKKQIHTDIYIVKKGDTLYAIAKKNNVNIKDLCQINNITQESILRIGQKLKLE